MGLKDIKNVVSSLSSDEFSRFQVWFEKLEAARQRKQRTALGKIRRGKKEFEAGKTRVISSLAEL